MTSPPLDRLAARSRVGGNKPSNQRLYRKEMLIMTKNGRFIFFDIARLKYASFNDLVQSGKVRLMASELHRLGNWWGFYAALLQGNVLAKPVEYPWRGKLSDG